jgi:hypothetical protein
MASGEILNPQDLRALNTLSSMEQRNVQAKDAIRHYASDWLSPHSSLLLRLRRL